MFKRLTVFFILIIFSLIFINTELIAQNQKSETYEQYLARIRRELQPYVVDITIKTPVREGRILDSGASGVAVFEEKQQVEVIPGQIVKYNSYYILTNPHIVAMARKEGELKRYKEDRVRIYIVGRNNKLAEAQIVAWEWTDEVMLLQVNILEKELEDFNIQVVKIADKLPFSLYESKGGDKDPDTVYLCGYPMGLPVANSGYITRYLLNFDFSYSNIVKVAAISVDGFNAQGQSGGGVFNQNKELVAIVFGSQYLESNLIYAVTIDAIVERFLKQLPELKKLALPNFNLEPQIKNRPIYLNRPEN